jgi:hypothetical protein
MSRATLPIPSINAADFLTDTTPEELKEYVVRLLGDDEEDVFQNRRYQWIKQV